MKTEDSVNGMPRKESNTLREMASNLARHLDSMLVPMGIPIEGEDAIESALREAVNDQKEKDIAIVKEEWGLGECGCNSLDNVFTAIQKGKV